MKSCSGSSLAMRILVQLLISNGVSVLIVTAFITDCPGAD